jgi:hypothetical protein
VPNRNIAFKMFSSGTRTQIAAVNIIPQLPTWLTDIIDFLHRSNRVQYARRLLWDSVFLWRSETGRRGLSHYGRDHFHDSEDITMEYAMLRQNAIGQFANFIRNLVIRIQRYHQLRSPATASPASSASEEHSSSTIPTSQPYSSRQPNAAGRPALRQQESHGQQQSSAARTRLPITNEDIEAAHSLLALRNGSFS